ncbi:forkhead box protein N3-like [Neocloeon triangulifer]|uniref:forkhead box protein N3-like n=1 Tax=Neocloeon triangulifer TaxID=2078957 RepID=UPI00286F94C9|nr:forkhead box protein N3-like [Neocloeon triangulifer]
MAPERPGSDDERCTVGTVHLRTQAGTPNADILKEGDGAAKVFADVRVGSATQEDDDLTPLSWLQDKNLLRDIPLSGGTICTEGSTEPVEVQIEIREESVSSRADSPTSDYAEESSEHADSSSNSDAPPSPTTLQQAMPISPIEHYDHDVVQPPPANTNTMSYDPRVHTNLKPPYSFSCLIFMAIEDSATQKLPVKDIYAWIVDHFPYFQGAPTGWKNSVRHNLSLNKCFKKVDKSPSVGKGSLWMVDHCYRPNLLQALRKVPYHPYMQLERFNALNNNNNNTIPSGQSCRLSNKEIEAPLVTSVGRNNLPNPTLFPFLSRRLAAAGLQVPCAYPSQQQPPVHIESQEDVNAATAMLALKHGPRILSVRGLPDRGDHAHRPIYRTHHEAPQNLIITTSPSADHTYSAGPRSRSTLSPDEAYGEGSSTSSNESSHEMSGNDSEDEAEEQRKIAEGADALLNLAGICTSHNPLKRSSSHPTDYSVKRGRGLLPMTLPRRRAPLQEQHRRREQRFHNR